ncbi:MAG: hypothetical protein CVU33_06745 [Betaproteobacteria bacterium HGW-Betaproteobacteria-6]|nr:MAG: hypothetical protein CVU33_06745 [Betaproteobacteria bacterium HGW-Betaproteobacteria-6]
MTPSQLEKLLFRAEGSELDFKADQYVFSKNDLAADGLSGNEFSKKLENKKSELLKDLLAMANSWRDGPAHILIGFEENKPSLPNVVGIAAEKFYDDARFQQFIASKIHGTLDFSYEVVEFRGIAVGIFTIPKQSRPVFSKETYGVVQKDVVYVRRGSSTDTARPDEIAQMGAEEAQSAQVADVSFEITDDKGVALAGTAREIKVAERPNEPLPDFEEARSTNPFEISINRPNRSFWKELRTYAIAKTQGVAVRIAISNKSGFALSDCELHVIAKQSGNPIKLADIKGRNQPSPYLDLVPSIHQTPLRLHKEDGWPEYKVIEGSVAAEIPFHRILPGGIGRAKGMVLVLPVESGQVELELTLFARELPEPIAMSISFQVSAEFCEWNIERLSSLVCTR